MVEEAPPMNSPRKRVHAFFSVLSRTIGLLALVGAFNAPAYALAPAGQPANPLHFTPQMRIGFRAGDDWEPAITADRFGHVYVLYKHYDVAGAKTCKGCDLHLLIQRSEDGGRSWDSPRPIAPGPAAGGQFDSQIAVDPVDGKTLWASFLQGDNSTIAVVKSTDFGETWSKPRIVSTQPPGLDKDELAVRGNTILVAYDDNLNTYAAVSLDGGKHWASQQIFAGGAQFNLPLSAGAAIDSQGNLFISWESFDQAHSENGDGPVTLWVTRSGDHGKHWTRKVIDVSGAPPACSDCGFSFLGSQMALQVGGDDSVYLLWNGTADQTDFAPARIFFARSSDHGLSFSHRRQVSDAPQGAENAFPSLATGDDGDVRLGWMDTRAGSWNVFYRASQDGGAHLGPVTQVSSFVPGYPYLTANGFDFPYGDYFSMAVDADGRTQLAFGEGPSYAGPGNIWVSHSYP
jgi:hypothetical protein